MRFWIGVENFAKIESAKVCVNDYTLFVGPNNSGKTFLMQLIQGLTDKIVELLDEEAMNIVLTEKIEGYSKYLINKNNIVQFIEYINKRLYQKKQQIIKQIFGREISIEKLYIDIELEKNISYQIDITDIESMENEKVKKLINQEMLSRNFSSKNIDKKWNIGLLSEVNEQQKTEDFIVLNVSIPQKTVSIFRNILQYIFPKDSLFLPASRTGLMFLYRDFFANKTDDAVFFRIKKDQLIADEEQYGGLTEPIYEFLRFLQTYSEDEENYDIYIKELSFFENKIIEGHINTSKQGKFSYHAKNDSNIVPMYLASAMVNEVAPFILALTSERPYERLIIDEVEASLHPQKQLELVRFLNRINNRGIKIILSTHSDTFVSKLNNLYILSEYAKENDEIEKQFHLEKEDLIPSENLFVYEFIFQPNGKSVVKKIIPDSKTGFQFDLFTKSAMELYEEALRLGEMNLNG